MRSRAMPEQEQWVVAYWLLPASDARDFFGEIIQRLAAKYEAPVFEPHLTLAVRPDTPDEAEQILAQAPGSLVELRPLEMGWTAKFTKTLFLRFASSELLRQLRCSIGAEGDFDPHLSLLYQRIPETEQARLAAETQVPFPRVNFDRIVAIRCRLPVETVADVAAWQLVASRKL